MNLKNIILGVLYALLLVVTSSASAQISVTAGDMQSLNRHLHPTFGTSGPVLSLLITNNSSQPQELTGIRVVDYPSNLGLTKLIAFRDNHNETMDNIGETADFYWHTIPVSHTLQPHQTESIIVQGEFAPSSGTIAKFRCDSVTINNNTEVWFPEIAGNTQYLMPSPVANFFLLEQPAITKVETDGLTESMTVQYKFKVTAWGGDITKPQAKDFTIMSGRNKHAPNILCYTSAVTVFPDSDIAEGSEATVTVYATLTDNQVSFWDKYGFAVKQVHWSMVGGNGVDQYWGFEDTKVQSTEYFRSTLDWVEPVRTPAIHYLLYDLIGAIAGGGEDGIPAQVCGEGGILHFSPIGILNRMQVGYVVMSQNNEMLGSLLRVGFHSYDNQTFNPKVSLNVNPNSPTYEDLTPLNVSTQTSSGIEVAKMIEYVVDGTPVHCRFDRIGGSSFIARFYWGANSSVNGPGYQTDRADLSPSIPVPNKYPKGMPQRHKFELSSIVQYPPFPHIMKINAICIPHAFKVQGSADLVNWIDISCGWQVTGDPIDETGATQIEIGIDTEVGSYPFPQGSGFFRMVTR